MFDILRPLIGTVSLRDSVTARLSDPWPPGPWSPFPALEVELDRELHLPRIAERAGDPAEGGGVADVRGREAVVHPVEQVEGLDAQLEPLVAAQDNRAEELQVHRLRPRPAHGVVAAVAVGAAPVGAKAVTSNHASSVWSKPSGTASPTQLARVMRPGPVPAVSVAVIVNGRPSLRVRMPFTDQSPRIAPATPSVDEAPSRAERQLVDEAGHEAVRDVEGQRAVVGRHVVGVLREVAGGAAAGAQVIEEVAQRLAPGVGHGEGEPVAHPPLHPHLQRVVVGAAVGDDLLEEGVAVAVLRVREDDACCPARSRPGSGCAAAVRCGCGCRRTRPPPPSCRSNWYSGPMLNWWTIGVSWFGILDAPLHDRRVHGLGVERREALREGERRRRRSAVLAMMAASTSCGRLSPSWLSVP